MSLKRVLKAALVAGVALAPLAAHANEEMCEKARSANLDQVSTQISAKITLIDAELKSMKANGTDPTKLGVKLDNSGKFYTLPEIRARLVNDRDQATAAINTKADRCSASLKPLQDAMDSTVSTLTGGLTDVLPGKMGYVDVSRILAGYPLGGPEAIIPKFRDQLLAMAGINGDHNDLGNIIKSPFGPIINAGPCSMIKNPLQRGC